MTNIFQGFAHAAGPFTLACCLFDVFVNFSVEIVAGSLVSGVVSLSRVLQSPVFFGADVVSFGAQSVPF